MAGFVTGNMIKNTKMIKNEGFKVLRERHTTGEMHFPLLFHTFVLAEAALRPGSRSPSLRAASARTKVVSFKTCHT